VEEVGIILEVTPKVTPDGYIQLKLHPEVSSVDRVDENNIAIIDKRTAETEVIIKDGKTIVIGGLMETKRTETINRIPFLGDIPLLGFLFSHRQLNPNQKKELLIFVTARIVRDDEGSLLAYKTGIITSPSRPLKLDLREIKLNGIRRR
jgi:type II secretory pathway component GspD/PulD (secretin)